jgi:hypothetical protein
MTNLRLTTLLLAAAIPAVARADFQGMTGTQTTIALWSRESPCGPVTIAVTTFGNDSKVWLLGDTHDLEPGTPVRGETFADVAAFAVFDYDAGCEQRFTMVPIGGLSQTVEVVGSPPLVDATCYTPQPDGSCAAPGVRRTKNHASVHGAYQTDDGRTLRVDLELAKTDTVYLVSKVRLNPIKLAVSAILRDVPAYFGSPPDTDIDEVFPSPDPTTKYRYDTKMREARVTGSITLDGVNVLDGATPVVGAFMDISMTWQSPTPEINVPLPF